MKLVTFKSINKEIKGYGFNYSIKDFSKQLIIVVAAVLAASIFFDLKAVLIVSIMAFTFMLLPYIYKAQFEFMYEAKRFDDSILYMTQMISSFKKNGKILSSLREVREVVDDEIGIYVDEAIEYLVEGNAYSNIYREALSIIEEKYGCSRMKSLHDFLAKIETSGGEYENALDILNNDIEEWSGRVYLYQKDRKSIRSKINLAIFLAFVISGMAKLMIPEQFDFTDKWAYQIVTTITVVMMYIFYILVQSKMTSGWLDSKNTYNEDKIDKDFNILENYDERRGRVKVLPVCIVLLASTIYFVIMSKYTYALISFIATLYMYSRPANKKKYAKKRLEKEILKQFPDWLRNLSIEMQTTTVRVAISSSLNDAPYILQPYIEELSEKFDTDLSIGPYTEFLKEFGLKEVSSSMRALYSFNKSDKKNTEQQINALIKRNNEMLAKSEQLKNEDTTGVMGFFVLMPMIIGCVKLLVDLLLMFSAFMSGMATVV